jgi:hypothetical protein
MVQILLRLAGGLGNQLFQLSALEHAIQRCDDRSPIEIIIDKSSLQTYSTKRNYDSEHFFDELANYYNLNAIVEKNKICQLRYGRSPISFLPRYRAISNYSTLIKLFQTKKNIVLDGYFHHEMNTISLNFKEVIQEKIIRPIIQKNSATLNSINANFTKKCGIHVRRSDYLSEQNRHLFHTQDIDYYLRAIEQLNDKYKFYIFGDDIDFCKQLRRKIGTDRAVIVNNTVLVDFSLMVNCDALIISNSTFSFQAALLSMTAKEVISPKKWFKTDAYDFNKMGQFRKV